MDVSTVGTHTGSALLVVGTMQWLKKAKWFPLLKDGQKALNRFVSITAALFIQLGISYTYSPATNGGHTLLLEIPSYSVLAIGIFHWATQYIFQETGYSVLNGLLALKDIGPKIGALIQLLASQWSVSTPAAKS